MDLTRYLKFLCCLLLSVVVHANAAKVYNVRDFGALGDGIAIDSHAINAAIEKAAAEGGGTVRLPEGIYLSYSIRLKSHVCLHFDKGAVLKAAPVTETEGYDDAEPNDSHYQDFGHSHWHNSLLWGECLEDVALEGEGLIDGTGVLSRGEPRRGWQGPSVANKALALKECDKVRISGLSFLSCGHFALLLTGVDHLLVENVTADTNRDAFDIDCCEHVVIRNCRVNTVNDDAIVLKCSYALGRPKPTEHVLVENCHVSGYDVGSLLDGTCTVSTQMAPDRDGPTGRIKLGTESNGGFRHIRIRHCSFTHCRGLALETVDGAEIKDVRVSDIKMNDICNSPIYIRLGDRMRGPSDLPPSSVRRIRIRRVKAEDVDSRYACLIAGYEDHPVRDVKISHLSVQFRGGLTLDDVTSQRGSNPFFYKPSPDGRGVGKNYPEPSAHGIQPAWGFSVSHADRIRLRHVWLECMNPDERPVLFKDNVTRLSLFHFRSRQPSCAGEECAGEKKV